MSSSTSFCPQCGTRIPLHDTSGLCPKCLLAEGMSGSTNADVATLALDRSGSSIANESSVANGSGLKIGDYEVLEEIARGGMGVVYRARQLSLNRVVALKMILSGRFASESDVRRFRHEAESAAKLDHVGIVPIYEVGEHEGHHYFSMKLVEGGTLVEMLPSLRGKPQEAAALIIKVARAVHHAHQRGVLHRDLKPANILLDQQGHPLVSDLGLAKNIQADSDITRTGAIVGTPAYMAPEQASPKKEITTAADIYSLGAILYEALAGRPPHQSSSPIEMLRQLREEKVTPLRALDRSIPRTLELICQHCLEREPNQRYSSAAALSDDLQHWLDGEPVSVRPPSFGSAVGAAIRANLKSAMGSALIGVIVGVILSLIFIMSFCRGGLPRLSESSFWFPSEPHPAAVQQFHRLSLALPDWFELAAMMFAIVALIYVGMLNVWLVRPNRGSASFAMGMVCGLVMNTVVFTLFFGLLSGVIFSLNKIHPDVFQLGNAALGTPEQQQAAREWISQQHPDVDELPPARRSLLFTQKIYDDGVVGMPLGILAGVLISSVLTMVPSVIGTVFGSRVISEEQPRHALLLYSEMMFTLTLATVFIYLAMVWLIGGIDWIEFHWQQLPCIFAICVAAWAAFQRWNWRLRLLLSIFWLTALFVPVFL